MSRRGRVLFCGEPAGEIRERDEGYEFAYDSRWQAHPAAQPVSLALPLRAAAYRSRTMIPFWR